MNTVSSRKRQAMWAAIGQLGRLTDLTERRRQQLARAVGLNPPQWRVLEEIASEDFMPSLFARSQACAPAAVSRTLRQLLDRGLVAVEIAPEDARRRSYALTGDGARVIGELRRARERAVDAVWSSLPQTEVEDFARFAGELADRLEAWAASEES